MKLRPDKREDRQRDALYRHERYLEAWKAKPDQHEVVKRIETTINNTKKNLGMSL